MHEITEVYLWTFNIYFIETICQRKFLHAFYDSLTYLILLLRRRNSYSMWLHFWGNGSIYLPWIIIRHYLRRVYLGGKSLPSIPKCANAVFPHKSQISTSMTLMVCFRVIFKYLFYMPSPSFILFEYFHKSCSCDVLCTRYPLKI